MYYLSLLLLWDSVQPFDLLQEAVNEESQHCSQDKKSSHPFVRVVEWMLNPPTVYWSPHHHLGFYICHSLKKKPFGSGITSECYFIFSLFVRSKCSNDELKRWVYLMIDIPGVMQPSLIDLEWLPHLMFCCNSGSSWGRIQHTYRTHTSPRKRSYYPIPSFTPSLEGESHFRLSWNRWCFPSFSPLPSVTSSFITPYLGSLKFSRSLSIASCLVSRASYQLNGACGALRFQPLMLRLSLYPLWT